MAPRLSTISKRPFSAWGDVHVHADVAPAGNHFRRATRPLDDPCVIERRDDVLLAQRAALAHDRRLEHHPSVAAGAGAAARELLLAGIALEDALRGQGACLIGKTLNQLPRVRPASLPWKGQSTSNFCQHVT